MRLSERKTVPRGDGWHFEIQYDWVPHAGQFALLSAVPQLSAATGYTWKVTHPTEDGTLWLLWALAVLGWIDFFLVSPAQWRG
jgi:hypothetical protein